MIRQWPLVGRSEELQVIAEATRAQGDHARGIVLSGSAGVGKTRLAREAVEACAARMSRRHWIIGTASARSVPLGAFAGVASDFGPDPLRRVREVIDGLIGGARRGEVVVGIDDAHLLDDLSAFTVHQLVTRRLATVILTIRSGETPPDAITAIWKDLRLQRLELQPLSLTETARLLEHVLDGPVHSFSAQRLWQYTQGNALYLRHLLDSELDTGRLARRSGMWLWEGRGELSPTLAELVEARIAQAAPAVRDVLDALAVAEPLDSDVLAAVSDPDALAEAEALGLVTVDGTVRPPSVRVAHPMLGEVRRTGSLRMRRLRGRIAGELAKKSETDPRHLVRRAVLTVDSDLPPDPALLNAATWAAMQLLDLRLAETLAERAVRVGSGIEAKMTHVMALSWQERGHEAERVLAELADQTVGPLRAQIALLRALNFAVILNQTTRAQAELDAHVPADDEAARPVTSALRALIDVVRGHAQAAVDRATANLAADSDNALAQMLSIFALVNGLGELGRVGEVGAAAERGYRLADRSAEVSHLRVPLAFLHAYAYRPAGALAESDAAIARIRLDTVDVPFEGSWHVAESWHAFVAGLAMVNHGGLAEAQRLCRESLADAGSDHSGRMRKRFARLWLATVDAMAGEAADARREFTPIEQSDSDPDARGWHSERAVAEAWVCAAEGALTQAIALVRGAAAGDRVLGRPAWEVLLLQTATQFGDHTAADRLAELATEVEGPRAPVAAAHAAALAAEDGDALLDASRRYEAFGDRIAAADAAAQAVTVYRDAGLRGAAMTASAVAERLAAECGGALTPALSVVSRPQPFTARQREIISLAAQGLSNKEIAERLTMSIRSIEGHLFRASQRVGANSREQLIAILQGG
ncbi:regulatory protein, luxR family [Mycolicibacterium rutilum]|uniref:Regulatory protein, luxR family n=1 Tax=Mycolicibacterium rutilum TaxID=370526 RepID=A0A1H6IK31_MYCRU|nr:LuxR family transcriptional regulator [Mycolicibacterium rutilum]SEH49326.1 regulatory protein, luxR family [Mycolicibacterium rutilum]